MSTAHDPADPGHADDAWAGSAPDPSAWAEPDAAEAAWDTGTAGPDAGPASVWDADAPPPASAWSDAAPARTPAPAREAAPRRSRARVRPDAAPAPEAAPTRAAPSRPEDAEPAHPTGAEPGGEHGGRPALADAPQAERLARARALLDGTATLDRTATPDGTATLDRTATPDGTATPDRTATPDGTATPDDPPREASRGGATTAAAEQPGAQAAPARSRWTRAEPDEDGEPLHARTGDPDTDDDRDGEPDEPARRGRGSRTRGTTRQRPGRRRAPATEPPGSGAAAADAEPDPEQVARSIALRLLTGAPRSRAQLAEAMARRDVPEEVADRVLDRFTEVGLVDDAAYAEILVRSRHAERGLSRRALAMELRRRGVDEVTAGEALEQVDDADEEEAARALARKKLRATRGLDREVRLRRAYGALGRRGYGGSLVSRVVREELAAEGQDDEDGFGAD